MSDPVRILFVEDSVFDVELELHQLALQGLLVDSKRVATRKALLHELEAFSPDLVISDFTLPGFGGHEALTLVAEHRPDLPFIFVSGTIGEDHAIEALKLGAKDYVLKSNLARLATAVTRALDDAKIQRGRLEDQAAMLNFKRALDTHAIVSITDPQGRITYANDQFCQVSKYSREELLGKDHRIINSGRHPKAFFKDMWETIQAGMMWQGDICNMAKDGSFYWVRSTILPFTDRAGAITQYISVRTDITERYLQHERILRLSRIRALVGSINKAIVHIERLEDLYQELCRITVQVGGFKSAVLFLKEPGGPRIHLAARAGEELAFLLRPGAEELLNRPNDSGLVARVLRSGKLEVENDLAHVDGGGILWRDEVLRMGYRSMLGVPLKRKGVVQGVFVLFSDIQRAFDKELLAACKELVTDIAFASSYIDHQDRLQFLANHDPLTKLLNRSGFSERLDRRLATLDSPSLAVMVVNLVQFTRVNEGLSRDMGDAVLREISSRLSAAVESQPDCARLGADTFAVFLQESGDLTSPGVEERILSLFDKPIPAGEAELRMAARAGVARYPMDGRNAETLLRNAESAMRRARGDGQEIIFYSADLNDRTAETLDLMGRLRRAVDEQQFVLHYQPKVSLPHRRIEGVEALIRWNAPGQGLVPPGKFIHLLEESGLIQKVGVWALKQAASDYRAWRARGLRAPRIAVNVSSLQLRRPDFVRSVFDAIQPGPDCGVDVEITESMLMHDIEGSSRKLGELQDAGMRISIDDFGTGHSSLSYLARLPLDVLKIDRAFVMRMADRRDDHAIVAAIIGLAHTLGLKVVAEGVETEPQAQLLNLLGCDQMQGYLFSRPVPEEQLVALLESGSSTNLPERSEKR